MAHGRIECDYIEDLISGILCVLFSVSCGHACIMCRVIVKSTCMGIVDCLMR